MPSPAASELGAEAHSAYEAKDYARSAELYEQALAKGAREYSYDAACSAALAGRKERAFELLGRAAEVGGVTRAHAESDLDLVSLRGDRRWLAALDSLAKIEKREAVLWDSPSLATPFRDALSDDEKVAALSRFWSEVKYDFVDTDRLAEIDWDALYVAYLPRVRAAKSTYELYTLLQELCAKIKDAHTNVYLPQPLYDTFLGHPGLHTRLVEGHVLILEVWNPELRKVGIEPGMEIVRVNGIPVRDYAERNVAPTVSAATRQDREVRIFEYALLDGPARESLRISLRTVDGTVLERTVARKSNSAFASLIPAQARFERRLLAGNVAYVALNSFADGQAVDEYLKTFDELTKASGLIIDLRENDGGSSTQGFRVLATLVDAPFLTTSWTTRDYRPSYRAWGNAEKKYGEPATRERPDPAHHLSIDIPVAVLTSPRTFSAAEDFLVAFDQSKRGLIVGEVTGGSTGQPLDFRLPGGGSGRVCTKRDTYADGRVFVGVGIAPQLVVSPTVAGIRERKDPVLAAALAKITSKRQ